MVFLGLCSFNRALGVGRGVFLLSICSVFCRNFITMLYYFVYSLVVFGCGVIRDGMEFVI